MWGRLTKRKKSNAKPATYLGGNFTVSASNDSGGAITYSRVLLDELWLLDGTATSTYTYRTFY